MEPTFRFCTSADGTRIAYAIYGSGPPLLHPAGMSMYLALPEARAFMDALASRTMLVTFDRRGTGASTRDVEDLSPAGEASDIAAVADAAGLRSFTVLAESQWTLTSGRYISQHPERVERIAAWAPVGSPGHDLREAARAAREDWSNWRRVIAGVVFPQGPTSLQRAYSAALKDSMSAEMYARSFESWGEADLELSLPQMTVPVLVLSRAGRPGSRQATMRFAGLIPNSRVRFVAGTARSPFPEHEPVVEAVFEFMGLSGRTAADAALPSGTAIILFTDIAGSTELTERMGDAAFRVASRTVEDGVRTVIRESGGAPVDGKVLGDGVMAVFSSAAQAIDAARRCIELSAESELRLHVGLHAGDVIREEDNVYGGAVNIASRICGLCEPGEMLVSQTVRDLARTSAGATFEDRGEHTLKGIDDPVRLYAVRAILSP